MGIPKFFGKFILGKYKEVVANNTLPSNEGKYIETVEFDLGGLLHHSAEITYSYGDGYNRNRSKELNNLMSTPNGIISVVEEFCRRVTDEIEKLVRAFIDEVNPKYKRIGNLVIAMDGVAPFAKIIQQRTRRYRTILKDEEAAEGPNVMKPPLSWDSNSITPGTDFVDMFDRHIRGWIVQDNIRNLVYNRIIFSSYRKRGEGEHKLFAFRREGLYQFEEEIKTNDKPINICYGSDADLILLNLMDETKNVYIVRDKDKKKKFFRKGTLDGTDDHGVVLDVDKLRDIIVDEMTGRSTKDTMEENVYYSVIRDFILITFFLGNDFLPKVFCFADLPTALSEFMEIYSYYIFNTLKKKDDEYVLAKKPKGDITSDNGFLSREDGGINWEVLLIFIKKISKLEPNYLLTLGKNQKKDVRERKNMENNSVALDSAITMKNAVSSRSGDVDSNYTFDEVKFRNKWYNLALGPRTKAMRKFLSENNINYVSDESSAEMYRLYLVGLQWILLYYVRGTQEVNKFWSYTYTQAPMMSDIYLYTKEMIKTKKNIRVSDLLNKAQDPVFGPVHQLLSVMPPKSSNLLPKLYRDLLSDFKPLSYIAPHKFNVDYESAISEHEGLAILPVVNPYEIIRIVDLITAKKRIKKYILGKEELDTVKVRGVRLGGMKYSEYELKNLRRKGYEFIKKMGSDEGQSRKPYQGRRDEGQSRKPYQGRRDEEQSRKPYQGRRDEEQSRKPYQGRRDERQRSKSRKPYQKNELNMTVSF